ncbi:hypothetical protein GCM10023320_76750 [Pseudonocardia adelaidensis]|uniref:Uncharacterized protein n=2 Tax=Pseudonocardia adelaidensis TaxID=648754 RepID=A0ABP9P3J5_9PSEU
MRALGWPPGLSLDIAESSGTLVVRADPAGAFRTTTRGHLVLPARVRSWCGLHVGDRVLLAADPNRQQLLLCPPATLDAMIAARHALSADTGGSADSDPLGGQMSIDETETAATRHAELAAARLLLSRMGVSPADLWAAPEDTPPMSTFAEYIERVRASVGSGPRPVYGSYWNRILDRWAERRLDEITASDVRHLVEHTKTHTVVRRNARGGRSAGEHLIAALRCLYRYAEDDKLISRANNPALKVAKPRRLPSTRHAVPDTRLAEINRIAATTGNDPALDALLLRLHTETACRRGGALALQPQDLDQTQCLILLREKGDTVRRRTRRATIGPAAALPVRRTHHPPSLRPPLETHRRDPPVGGGPADLHALAAPHHSDLGRTQLRICGRPRLRGTHRRRRLLGHRRICARHAARNRSGARGADR